MKPKRNYGFWTILLISALFFSYLFSGVMPTEITLDNMGYIQEQFLINCKNPLANYWNEYTLICMAVVFLIWFIAFLAYLSKQRNYRFGKEFGSSTWNNPKKVTKKLAYKNDTSGTRILSKNVRISLDTQRTLMNNNLFIIGGSGTGKSTGEVIPNALECNSSYIFTDPKGELLRFLGNYLKSQGYVIKVLNLVKMDESDCYNPFHYLRDDTDVVKLITNLIKNTTPKQASSSEPFWEKAESLYLQALFYYVWKELPPEERNFNSVLTLLGEAEVNDDSPSLLDMRMEQLAIEKGEDHPAVLSYRKCVRGAGDTVRSIIISANSRLAFFSNPNLQRILASDNMDIPSLGSGVDGDQKTKTALFCVIPDNDSTYNFMVGMLYTQIFDQLYHYADHVYGGELPIKVEFWMDEFCNVALPNDYLSLLSTIRSRGIFSNIIIQNICQLKALFKDSWESIPGNCSATVYLGGNEATTQKYISEALGKETIDKKSSGDSSGQHGSSSHNYDVIGRELMTPAEVRKLNKRKCIILLDGEDPIMDYKYRPFNTKKYKAAKRLGKYKHIPEITVTSIKLLNAASVTHYRRLSETSEKVKVNDIDLLTFLKYDFTKKNDEAPVNLWEIESIMKSIDVKEEENQDSNPNLHQTSETDNLMDIIFDLPFTQDQREQIVLAIVNGIPEEDIRHRMLNPDLTCEILSQIRRLLESKNKKNMEVDYE